MKTYQTWEDRSHLGDNSVTTASVEDCAKMRSAGLLGKEPMLASTFLAESEEAAFGKHDEYIVFRRSARRLARRAVRFQRPSRPVRSKTSPS